MLRGGYLRFSLRPSIWLELTLSMAVLGLNVWSPGLLRPAPARPFRQPSSLAQQSSGPQQTQTQQPPQTVHPPVLKRPPIRLAMLRKQYQCAGGVQLTVLQEHDAVRVTLEGQTYDLKLAATNQNGVATKYIAGNITWSMTGDAGSLQDAADPAHLVVLAGDCKQQSILPPLASNYIRGSLNLPSGKDLPPNGKVHIQLLDVTSPVLPHESLAEETFDLLGSQTPINFELPFNPKRIYSPKCCAVYAEVLSGGRAIYTTGRSQHIINLSEPGSVSLQLQPVRHKPLQP